MHLTPLGIVLKLSYTNQEFRVQSAASCTVRPGAAQTSNMEGCYFHLTFNSSVQREAILRTWTPSLPDTCLLAVSPCSAVIRQFLNGRERRKKNQTNTTQCFFLWETYWQADPVDSSQYSYLWTEDFLVKLGSFLGFYCFFPKLIAEFLNKVGASDLFLSSCKICFFPHNLFYRNQVSEKLKGKGQQHHLQSQPRLKEQSDIPNSFHQIWGL